jgi:hypothetical protein
VRHYHLADRPERESNELHMRPCEGNADDRAGKKNGGDEMASANHHPASSCQTRLPRTPRGPIAMSLLCSRKGAVAAMLKVAWLRSRKTVRPFKGIFCDDISEFESYHLSQAVWSPPPNTLLEGRHSELSPPTLLRRHRRPAGLYRAAGIAAYAAARGLRGPRARPDRG